MARHLQVFSLLSRVCSPSSATPLASVKSCRFASSKPWSGKNHAPWSRGSRRNKYSDEMSVEEEQLLEYDVEAKLKTVIDKEMKRRKAVKYNMLRRQMTPSGPPPRQLTWDAIEQIRYLKREQPEEWTIDRLAEGFSVSPDVIFRVLKSKFIPSMDRKVKQNAKVVAQHYQQMLPSGAGIQPSGAGIQQAQLKLPGGHTQAVLAANKEHALISLTGQTQAIQAIQGKGLNSSVKSLISVTVPNKQLTTELSEDGTLSRPTEDEVITDSELTEEEEEEDMELEETWDGLVLSEEYLEEILEMDKPPPPVQFGREFFDEEGNFLYRI